MAGEKIVTTSAKIADSNRYGSPGGKKARLVSCVFHTQLAAYTFLFGFHVYFAFFVSKSRLSPPTTPPRLPPPPPLHLFYRSGRSTGDYVKSSPSARDLPTCTRTRIAGCFMADVLVSTCPRKERVRSHSRHYPVALRYVQHGLASGVLSGGDKSPDKSAWCYVLRVRKRAFVTYRDKTSAGL